MKPTLMKPTAFTLRYILTILVCFLCSPYLWAQVQITTHVLPPYQSRIADYASRPELMLVTLTNLSTAEVNVQLTAKITGDNGISAWVKPGYRSPSPITIQAGQSISLNGNDIAFLFDINKIEYTGISRADMTRGIGLLEGNYTLCIRALRYSTLEPISPDQPLGCTSFRISDVEPPRILSPFADQVLDTKAVQAFPITWSTPPGSPPGTQYKVKMVEMITPRNPNDAIQSTTALMEETVMQNMLLYGPAHPALVPGRKYALVVQAEDPEGKTFFRNRGISEVLVFTYGKETDSGIGTVSGGQKTPSGDPLPKKYATNTIKGKLLWAFKRSEEVRTPAVALAYNGNAGNVNLGAIINTPQTSVLVSHYLGYNPVQASNATALAQADPTLDGKKVLVNPILSAPGVSQQGGAPSSMLVTTGNLSTVTTSVVSTGNTPRLEAGSVMSASGASALGLSYENVTPEAGQDRHPLANTKITIRGVKSVISSVGSPNKPTNNSKPPKTTAEQDDMWAGLRTEGSLKDLSNQGGSSPVLGNLSTGASGTPRGNQGNTATSTKGTNTVPQVIGANLNPPNVLATGRTDQDGNFEIHFMDPKYTGNNQYERIVLTVETQDFETFEYNISMQELSGTELIDLGEKILLAKTYRLNPTYQIEPHTGEGLANPGMRVRLLRPKEEMTKNTYLQYERGNRGADRQEVVLGGRTYVVIAKDSIASSDQLKDQYKFSFAGLFYSGELRLEFEPINRVLKDKSSGFRMTEQKLASSQILVAQPTFVGTLVQPAVNGQVILKAGENLVPVSGAVLTVSFREEDRLAASSSLVTTGSLNRALTGQMNAVSTLLNGNSANATGVIQGSRLTQSGANVNMLASAVAINGTSQPVYVTAGNLLGNSNVVTDVSYQSVVMGDQYASEEALRKKYGYYTVRSDSTGQYYIGNLPLLKEGASYTVKLASVPSSFKNLEVTPGMEQQFIAGKGTMETRSFTISPEIFNIVGRVVDTEKKGIPFARAHFKGSTNYFETGEGGLFQTSYYMGNHTLIVEKEGYLPLEIKVDLVDIEPAIDRDKLGLNDKIVLVTVVKPGQEVMNMQAAGNWVQSVQNTNTVKNAVSLGGTFSPTMFGNAGGSLGSSLNQAGPQGMGNMRGPRYEEEVPILPQQLQLSNSFQAQINKTYKGNAFVFSGTETTDLGDVGPMLPRLGKVKFTVVHKQNGAPVANAEISLFDSLQYTNSEGIWLYEGFGGRATVGVRGPKGSNLVPVQRSIQIDETGKVTEIKIELEQGVKVYGTVRSGSTLLDNAHISVEGRDYLSAKTDASGNYELYLPVGEYGIRASKSGYFAKRESRQIQQGTDLQVDFVLEDGGGRNISTLLGFEIELDKAEQDGAGERWTGRFVNMKGVAPIFDKGAVIAIPFTGLRVTFDGQGNAIPQNNEVLTDVNNIPLKAFGFLPVLLKGEQQLKVSQDAQGKGKITGSIAIDVSKIQGSRGYTLPTNQPIFLALNEATGAPQIDVFKADAGTMPNVSLKLVKVGGGDLSVDLYGFAMKLDLSNSSISTEGIALAGEIKTPALGPISAANIRVEQFKLSKDLKIQLIKVQQQNLPSFNIGSWKAKMTALLFNESGFKIGGQLNFTIPQSSESTIDFSNLKLGKDALYGGEFNFPTNGISVYKIAQLTSGSQPLGFGRVGNTQVYYLAGSANMKFGAALFEKEIKIPSFQFQTDGRFLIEAPVNQTAQLAFARFKIASLTLSTLSGQKPYISVQGEFAAEIPGLKFEASDIRFSVNTGGQVGFSVGTIKGELSVAVLKAAVTVGLNKDGFEGGGKLVIQNTPIAAEIGFHYRKVNGGVDLGAKFSAGVSIPIGIVEITEVGGGFSYNTATKKFMVNITGGATITGMRALVELKPISLTVESGPIITGHVGVVVGTAFKLVDAYTVLNFRDKFFAITVNSDIEPIKGVARARLNGLLKIKWDPNESYVFLGANMDVNILNILKNYGEFALGVNIQNPKTRGDEIASYFKYLEGDLYNGNSSFSGIYLHSSTSFGVPRDKAVGIGGDVFGVRAWFHTTSDAVLVLNFAESDYRFRLGGTVDAGGEGCFIGICLGGGFSTCYALMGGYSDANGWSLGGRAGGRIEIQIGKRAECGEITWCLFVPCGGRVCVGAHAALDISTKRGLQFSVGMGNSNTGNLCR